MPPGYDNFYKILTSAVNDLTEHGFADEHRLQDWIRRIRESAEASLISEETLEERLKTAFRTQYRRLVDLGGLLKYHPGVSRFTLDKVRPALRRELDRRLMASRDLIKLNRARAIEQTTQRFAGWATSIPAGGSDAVDRNEVKGDIRKALKSLPFEERRCAIDQGAKFVANLSNILAVDGGAIAARWNSHFHQTGYNYREDHKERALVHDGIYVVRGSYELEQGLMKINGHQYVDEVTMPGEEVYCRCWYTYLYSLRDLPPGMVTEKGRSALARARALIDA